jgi:hypothetical protein
MKMRKSVLFAIGLSLIAAPVMAAQWNIVPASQPIAVAKSGLTVTPSNPWNRWKLRPSKKGEIWTQDGVSLNALTFSAGIAAGEPLYKERNKKDLPLPKFNPSMTAPDLVQMFEATNRILLKTSLFEIDNVEPAKLAGHDGVRFSYHYVVQEEEVRRKGEARAAIIGGKLYLIDYAAPAIHYYDAGIAEARAIMDGARL